jgi:hypothetical protein
MPRPAVCSNEQYAAVETTFGQFYPTLLALARAKQTLSPGYPEGVRSRYAVAKLGGTPLPYLGRKI